jgi:hypothetical protein
METITELVTPEKAAEYLQKNKVNRDIRKAHVAEIADLISREKWQLNHQGIAFNKNGDLLDGQHRLLAIIKSGKTVPLRITRNLDIDQPMGLMVDQLVLKRNAADMMMTPVKATQIAAVIARLCNGWNKPPIDYIQECMEKLKDEIELVSSISTNHIALLGKAAVKAAAVAMHIYDKTDYAFQSLARLNAQDFANMTPVEHSYSRILASRSYKGERPDETFARALSVFDQRNANANKLYISDVSYSEVKAAVVYKIKEAEKDGN